jgi:hypothetical protein
MRKFERRLQAFGSINAHVTAFVVLAPVLMVKGAKMWVRGCTSDQWDEYVDFSIKTTETIVKMSECIINDVRALTVADRASTQEKFMAPGTPAHDAVIKRGTEIAKEILSKAGYEETVH